MLQTRMITGFVLTVMILLVICFSHITWLLNLVIAVLSVQANFELFRASGNQENKAAYYISCIFAVIISFVNISINKYIVAIVFAGVLLVFAVLMKRLKKTSAIPVWLCCLISVSFSLFFKTMSGIRALDSGIYILSAAVLVSTTTDIAAYFVGKGVGKHKAAPVISPNKTVEGCVGGLLFSVTILLVLALVLDSRHVLTVNFTLLAIYLFTASVIGQLGDFSLSTVKRIVHIKDYGALLPGHGGILDRFDSLLFVLPYTYLFFT